MAYCVRFMRKEDVYQVNVIDREAFPTQWPPPNYRHELDNQLAHYIVVCDDARKAEMPGPKPAAGTGLLTRIRRWFGKKSAVTPPPQNSQYVAGFAGIWVMTDESHLTNIAVRQSYQRQGIGEMLLISVIELSAKLNANIVTLEVRVSNAPAQELYRKYGFTNVGLRKGYYTDNREDALLMSTDNINSAAFKTRFEQLKQAHTQKMGAAKCRLTYPVPPDTR
ncbi:MAG: ribosomal protein S18-alanine N-acetyltransferase [Chloroflexi bacterium]|nr:ribosomal protein S18-alanine N-acetyltransferase [Chloroflexota bacterium]